MLSGISIWQLLIVLVIIIMIFGTKKLRNLGGDLGSAIKNFKSAVNEGDKAEDADKSNTAKSEAAPKPLPSSTQNEPLADADFDKPKDSNKTNS